MAQPIISKQLESIRKQVYERCLTLVVAARAGDREMLVESQAGLDKLWGDWDAAIQAVATLEQSSYDIAQILAADDEE